MESLHTIYPHLPKKDGAGIEYSPLNPHRTHPRVTLEIPLGSTLAQSGAPAFNSKILEARVIAPTSKALIGLIRGSVKG